MRGNTLSRNRRLAVTLVTLSVAAGLTSQVAVARKTTIRWWMGSYGAMSIWKDLAKRYETENPQVKVQLLQGSLEKFYAMATAGLMPDVWGTWDTPGLRADINRNWAVDLTPYIKQDWNQMDAGDFFPGMMRVYRINGKLYSLPMFLWQDYFFYNTDLYAQAGLMPPPMDSKDRSWNWDRMLANALKLSKTDSRGKLQIAGIDFYRGVQWNPGYLQMWGAKIYSDAALASSVPQQVSWDSKEVITALTKVHDLTYKHNVAPALETGTGEVGFAAGKTAQVMGAGWITTPLMKQKKLKWAITTTPWAVTNEAAMWPDGWRMSKVAKDKAQVWDFMKFLTSPKSMTFTTTDPTGAFQGSGLARRSVFYDTIGKNLGRASGMDPADVLSVTAQADAINAVAYYELICIHLDLTLLLEPTMGRLWMNKLSPVQASKQLQDITDKRLPDLFKRWIRNIKFTGAE